MSKLVMNVPGTFVSLAAVVLTTWIVLAAQTSIERIEHIPYSRPFGIVYVIPIALITAIYGLRTGIATLLFAVGGFVFIMMAPDFALHVTHPRDVVELTLMIIVGSLLIYSMEAVRLNPQIAADVREARLRLNASEQRRAAFNREVLLAVTGGHLLLCEPDELRKMVEGEPAMSCALRESADAARLRQKVRHLYALSGEAPDHKRSARLDDFLTCLTEAATNAVKHGGKGMAEVWLDACCVIAIISDHGPGILPNDLARATLQSGYSSRATLGMGFELMLQTTDLLALATSEKGTEVLLRVGSDPLPTPEERTLAQFSGMDLSSLAASHSHR